MYPCLQVGAPTKHSSSHLALSLQLKQDPSRARFEYIPPLGASSRDPSPRRPRSLKSLTANSKPRVPSGRASFESTRSAVSRAVSSVRKSRRRRQKDGGALYDENEGDGDDEREERHTMTSMSAASETDLSSHCHNSVEGRPSGDLSHDIGQAHEQRTPGQTVGLSCPYHDEAGHLRANAHVVSMNSSAATSLDSGVSRPHRIDAYSTAGEGEDQHEQEHEETIATPRRGSYSSFNNPQLLSPPSVAKSKTSNAKRRAMLLERNWPVMIPVRKSSREGGSDPPMFAMQDDLLARYEDAEGESEGSESPVDAFLRSSARSSTASVAIPVVQAHDTKLDQTAADRQVIPSPPAPQHPSESADVTASFMERNSMISVEVEEDVNEQAPLSGRRTSRSSTRASPNRYAWYLQDEEVSALSAVVEKQSEEDTIRETGSARKDRAMAKMDGQRAEVVQDTTSKRHDSKKSSDEDKTPTLKPHRVSQSKLRASKVRNASGSSEDTNGTGSTQSHTWERYQEKAMCGICETGGALPTAATLVTTMFPSPSTSPTTSTTHTTSSSAPSKPSTSSTSSRFPMDRIALRRQEEIELTTDDLTLFDVMAREAYIATMKRQEQGRKRQELLSMRYELPIPKSPAPGRRPASVLEKKRQDGEASDEGTGGKGLIEHRMLWNPPVSPRSASKWRLRLSSSSNKTMVQVLGSPTKSPPTTPARPKSLDRPRSTRYAGGSNSKPPPAVPKIRPRQSLPAMPPYPAIPHPSIPPLRPLPPLPLPFAMEAIATLPESDRTPTRHSFSSSTTTFSSSSTITPTRKRSLTVNEGKFQPHPAAGVF